VEALEPLVHKGRLEQPVQLVVARREEQVQRVQPVPQGRPESLAVPVRLVQVEHLVRVVEPVCQEELV
jgi:hypothetical protein